VLPCAWPSPCAVPHGEGRTCGAVAACVAIRCHAGYAFVEGAACVCTGAACGGRRAGGVRYRPSVVGLVLLAGVAAVLAAVACPHWTLHHQRHRPADPALLDTAAKYRRSPRPPPAPPAAAPAPLPTRVLGSARTRGLRPPSWAL
jgi:hypothetical protein